MSSHQPCFAHHALFYADADEFLAATVPFVSEAVQRQEPVMVAVTQPRERILRGELGELASSVRFVDMERLGRNPGRIIPAWQRFVNDARVGGGRSVRGIGEPIWAGRSAAELEECERHEALLNLAFAGAPAWELLCPYDTAALDDSTLERACHTHPHLRHGTGRPSTSGAYARSEALEPFEGMLPGPESALLEMRFDIRRLAAVRRMVAATAVATGVPAERACDLTLAVNELASNSIRHGGGHGMLALWRSDEGLTCEVRDAGRLTDPLSGRRQPSAHQLNGRGLWLAHELCDLVQVRSSASGTVVRVLMRRA